MPQISKKPRLNKSKMESCLLERHSEHFYTEAPGRSHSLNWSKQLSKVEAVGIRANSVRDIKEIKEVTKLDYRDYQT